MPARGRPNILLLCTDQQRYDSLGVYGNPAAQTPVLDRLAVDGTLFKNCYVQNTICSPSRASLFTGMYARNHGLWANGVALPAHRKLFTRALADAGYDCGMVGKQHLAACAGWQTEPRRDDGYRVFEWAHDPIHGSPQNAYHRWLADHHPEILARLTGRIDPEAGNVARTATPANLVPVEAHFSHWVAERSIAFIAEPARAVDQPFFLIANFFDPHHPFGAPGEYRRRFDAAAIAPPVGSQEELLNKPAVQREYSKASYAGQAPGFLDYAEDEIREVRAAYHAMIAFIDSEVGRVLEALERSGRADDTLVVFTSDHGELLGDHQMLLKGPMMYDCCARVPLVMRWPGRVAAGQRRDELVQWIDLTATLLDVADAHGLPDAQGSSLMPLAAGGPVTWRRWALSEYRDAGHPGAAGVHTTMLRWDDTKLVLWHGDPAAPRETEGELYDLANDPDELVNLYDEPSKRELRETMKDRLLNVLAATEDRSQPRLAPW